MDYGLKAVITDVGGRGRCGEHRVKESSMRRTSDFEACNVITGQDEMIRGLEISHGSYEAWFTKRSQDQTVCPKILTSSLSPVP